MLMVHPDEAERVTAKGSIHRVSFRMRPGRVKLWICPWGEMEGWSRDPEDPQRGSKGKKPGGRGQTYPQDPFQGV